MILPVIRSSFGRRDAQHLVQLLGRSDEELRAAAQARLDREGVDALLDDPRVLNALLTDPDVTASPEVVFYVLVRQALLEGGMDDPAIADYVASLVLGFGKGARAYRVSDEAEEEFHYLVDMVAEMDGAGDRRAFLLRVHMGSYSLWITGLFPDYLEARVQRRGAPPIRYYEQMGAVGYRMAAESREAEDLGMDALFRDVATNFRDVRTALNRVSDRYLWPGAANPVNRFLRDVIRRSRD